MLLDNLFTNKTLVILYILESKKQIQLTFLLNTNATDIGFIDEAMACTMCESLKISFLKLAKSKPLKKFNGGLALFIYTQYILY